MNRDVYHKKLIEENHHYERQIKELQEYINRIVAKNKKLEQENYDLKLALEFVKVRKEIEQIIEKREYLDTDDYKKCKEQIIKMYGNKEDNV